MSDFFEQLEGQLLDAARERPKRLRRARVRRTATALASVAALGTVGAGLAAGLTSDDHDAGPAGTITTPTDTTPLTDRAELANFRVAVLNATGSPGLAGRVAQQLQAHGVRIGTVTNIPPGAVDRTRVYFRRDHLHDGILVAARLPGYDGQLWQLRPGSDVAVTAPDARVVVVLAGDHFRRILGH